MVEAATAGTLAALKGLWWLLAPVFLIIVWALRLEGLYKILLEKSQTNREDIKLNREIFTHNDEKIEERLDTIHADIKKLIWDRGNKG